MIQLIRSFCQPKQKSKRWGYKLPEILNLSLKYHDATHILNYTDIFCPLGMQDGHIADSQITASSVHSTLWAPYKARLNGGTGWHPNGNRGKLLSGFIFTLIS